MKKLTMLVIGLALILTASSAQAWMVGDWGGWAVVGNQLTKSIDGYVGYSFINPTNWYLVKVDCNLAKINKVQTKAGLDYQGSSTSGGLSTSQLSLTWGISTMVQPNMSVGADLVLAAYHMTTGTNTVDILPAAMVNAMLYL